MNLTIAKLWWNHLYFENLRLSCIVSFPRSKTWISLMKSELLKFYSGDLNLKRLVSEVYRTFLMLPFHSSFHLSVPVVQTDISHGTVPFNSVRQSRVTGPSKSPKCHVGHGNFYKVPKSFCDLALKYRNFLPPAAQNCGKSPNVTVYGNPEWAAWFLSKPSFNLDPAPAKRSSRRDPEYFLAGATSDEHPS